VAMREIIFRAKSVDNSEWVYGLFANIEDKGCYLIQPHELEITAIPDRYGGCEGKQIVQENIVIEVDPETIGQFTGMKDKNGVMVFEGDIYQNIAILTFFEPSSIEPYNLFQYDTEVKIIKHVMPSLSEYLKDPFLGVEFCDNPEYKNQYDEEEIYDLFNLPIGIDEGTILEVFKNSVGIEAKSIKDLLPKINGFTIIGNVHDNPELLTGE
jgi:uncharacterized phage protein (TIGR01671 family)